MKTLLGTALAVVLLPAVLSASGHTDTLSYFDTRDVSAFYRDPGITDQAARFDLAAPAYLRRVTLWLSGDTGTATLTVFGNEAAFAAPLLGTPLSRSIEVTKKRRGVEKIIIEMPEEIFIDRPQFFLVVSDLTPGVRWLSDRIERAPQCVAGSDRWYYQAIRREGGSWLAGKYAYAVEAVVDVPESFSPGYFADITADAEFGDEVLEQPSRNRSIAWADVDDDGRYDVLVGGRLFVNRGDDRFEEFTSDANLPIDNAPVAHVFIDIDNDADPDILWVESEEEGISLMINDGTGEFSRSRLEIPAIPNPTTISIADPDRNGYLDVFIGQGSIDNDSVLPSYLLLNSGKGSFTAVQLITRLDESLVQVEGREVVSAQWIGANRDDIVDLSLTLASGTTGISESHVVLINDGTGRFSDGSESTAAGASTANSEAIPLAGQTSVPSDWGDVDGDGSPDYLQPISLSPDGIRATSDDLTSSSVDRVAGTALLEQGAYQAFAGAGTWGDADNDGRLDALVTSACNCRFATLYLQERTGEAVDRSFEYGLFRIPAGNDAVWVDYNTDGLLDLATFVDGHFRLFKNTLHEQNNHVEVDLAGDPNPAGSIGGAIHVHAGEKVWVRPIYSGRGALMQGPSTFHFGLGAENQIDSIVYRPLEGEDIVLLQPEANRVHKIFDDRSRSTNTTASASMSVSPNPFTTVLRFQYELATDAQVTVKIHAVDGTVVGTPIDGTVRAGTHTIEWKPLDRSGDPLPAGTYIWRAVIGSQTFTGRSILAK